MYLKIAALSLTLLLLTPPVIGQDRTTQELPDTAAGKRVAAYIKAFNSDDEKVFSDFLTDNLSSKSLASRPIADRLKVYHQIHEDFGTLEFKRLVRAKEDGITVLMKGSTGQWMEMEFQLESEEAHRITGLRIGQAQPPNDSGQEGPRPGTKASNATTRGLSSSSPDRIVATTPVDNKQLSNRLDEFASRAEAFGFTGAVLVAKGGEVVLEKGYGLANRERHVPFTRETVFDIGSNAKEFTKMAILQLAEKGRLTLDDPITKFFDNVPPDKAQITVLQLMKHTAGVILSTGPDPERISREEMLKRAFAARLLSEPGKEFHYSNPGFSMLAAIIEIVSQESYDHYVNEHILKPAGMTKTGYVIPQWKPDEITRSYVNGEDHGATLDYPHFPDGPSWSLRGNGAMLSTLDDMYKFHLALRGETLLSNKSKPLLFPQDQPVMQVGGDGIHFFVYLRDPQNDIAIIAASTDADMRATDMSEQLAAILRGKEYEAPPQTIKVDPAILSKFAGTYRLPSGAEFGITVNDGHLAVIAVGQEAFDSLATNKSGEADQINKLNARTASIVEASVKGDYGPWAEAFGGRVPLDQIKSRQEALWLERKTKLGPYKGLSVLGTITNAIPARQTTQQAEPPYVTTLRLEFERGAVFVQYVWDSMGLRGVRPLSQPPVVSFLPISDHDFASYDLVSGQTQSISFRSEADGSATHLIIHNPSGDVVANESKVKTR